MQDLVGRSAWITGAGSGIGRAIALSFAGAGVKVALTGRRKDALAETKALVEAAGGEAMLAPADVTVPAQVTAAHQAVVQAWGDPDILVNDAGGNAKRRHWGQLSAEDMSMVVDVNLKGPFLCSLAVLPAMRARTSGTLIHISSFAGTGTFLVSGPTYSAAKHAVRSMSATMNAEEGIHNIRSICINPGEVATPILDSRPRPPTAEERAIMVQPEDIAEAALFAARLPPRSCVMDMTVVPTNNNAFRHEATRIAAAGA